MGREDEDMNRSEGYDCNRLNTAAFITCISAAVRREPASRHREDSSPLPPLNHRDELLSRRSSFRSLIIVCLAPIAPLASARSSLSSSADAVHFGAHHPSYAGITHEQGRGLQLRVLTSFHGRRSACVKQSDVAASAAERSSQRQPDVFFIAPTWCPRCQVVGLAASCAIIGASTSREEDAAAQ